MNDISIEVEGLKKSYGKITAVDGVSFKVKSGYVFGMLGPNGAGKTTTIEAMVGLVKKDEGRISILGISPDKEQDKIKKIIGVQLQSPNLFPRLTVSEILKLFASFYANPLDVRTVMERVGLEGKAGEWVKNLSGGQKHRLAVGLAMVGNGKVLFFDEPTTGLDPQSRRQLWNVILDLKKEGKTIFFTTHYMDEAEKLCDYLIIIDKGKVIAQGAPKDLIDEFFQETAIEFTDPGFRPDEKEQLEAMRHINRVNYMDDADKIVLYSEDVSSAVKELLNFAHRNNKPVEDIFIRRASLEDVFLKLTGRGIRE